ncbi:MAG: NYN domain-containing protein [Candidatus Tokpelaia sp.]|uniref:NYN domain-containing protein n=1 Tax=Candidatus Tokpelaia sp. TaxID=2233777 RepID=UPI00123C1B20|nr:NYN domain-containing protein [Candidatus Tokpelaia sp.]KAA6206662.1 MAG: NYN domain-containing protein [Candidatus Tokpelaia sp.]KAA6206957.1 MAG: NYN domain-containing protein [Candidatus Tokpelaia sp.]KAA6405545.1 hypothetical protein DPQ22_04385 [Candidatus Tokpelaia sp.]
MKFIYVDNSNLLYGGRGVADSAGWSPDYNALRLLLCGKEAVICPRPKIFGSFNNMAKFKSIIESAGCKLVGYEKNNGNTDDYNYASKEKKVDVAIAHQITKDAYSSKIAREHDEIILVSGDRDFVPVVEDLVEECFIVRIYSWEHTIAWELKNACSQFISLNAHLDFLNCKT